MTNTTSSTITYSTGLKIAAPLLILSLLISAVIYPQLKLSLAEITVLTITFSTMVFSIAYAVSFQRIRLDNLNKKIAYSNMETFYQWREFNISDIKAIKFSPAQGRSNRMIDSLFLTISNSNNHEWSAQLIDSNFAIKFDKKPSAFFIDIINFIKITNKNVKIPSFT